jgi:hypothetical protein
MSKAEGAPRHRNIWWDACYLRAVCVLRMFCVVFGVFDFALPICFELAVYFHGTSLLSVMGSVRFLLLFLRERLFCLLCYWFCWTRLSNQRLVHTTPNQRHWRIVLRGLVGEKFVSLC